MKLKEIIEILQKNSIGFDVVDLLECHNDEILDEVIEFDCFSGYIDKLVELVQSKIELCQSCDHVQTVDSYNRGITEQGRDMSMYRHLSSGEDVDDFIQGILQFQDLNFDSMDLVDKIKTRLVCPKCGSESVEQVYTKDSIDIFWSGFSRNDLERLNSKYSTDITGDNLEELRAEFTQNPLMLSYDNSIIKDFIKILKAIHGSREYETIAISQNLYRGRVFSENTIEKQHTEFLAPPVLQSSHGRFNLIGESNVLYLATGKDVIPFELNYLPNQGYLYIAKFKQPSSEMKLIDINKIFSELPKQLFFDNSIDSRYVKEKYILPNIFSACAKYCNFDGIIYNSVHLDSESRNIALFKNDKIDYVSNECLEYNISYEEIAND